MNAATATSTTLATFTSTEAEIVACQAAYNAVAALGHGAATTLATCATLHSIRCELAASRDLRRMVSWTAGSLADGQEAGELGFCMAEAKLLLGGYLASLWELLGALQDLLAVEAG